MLSHGRTLGHKAGHEGHGVLHHRTPPGPSLPNARELLNPKRLLAAAEKFASPPSR